MTSQPTITITPTHTAAVILRTTLPDGTEREITISERDGWDTLLGVLHRLNQTTPLTIQQQANRAAAAATITWVPGTTVRFAPPNHSPWRDSVIWPSHNPDFICVTIHGESMDGQVEVHAMTNSGRQVTVKVLPKHLRHPTRTFTAKGKPVLTLEDLGL